MTNQPTPTADLERQLAHHREVLTNLMPFVLDDYYPNCATPAYRQAVEAAKALMQSEQTTK